MNDIDRMIKGKLKAKAVFQRELAARPVNAHRDVLDGTPTGRLHRRGPEVQRIRIPLDGNALLNNFGVAHKDRL